MYKTVRIYFTNGTDLSVNFVNNVVIDKKFLNIQTDDSSEFLIPVLNVLYLKMNNTEYKNNK